MNKVVITLLVAVLMSIIGVLGDFFIKLSGNSSKFMDVRFFIVGAVIYALTAFGWFYVMKNAKLTTLGVFYTVTTVLFLALVSVFYFKEKVTHLEVAGIAAAILSLVLMSRFA